MVVFQYNYYKLISRIHIYHSNISVSLHQDIQTLPVLKPRHILLKIRLVISQDHSLAWRAHLILSLVLFKRIQRPLNHKLIILQLRSTEPQHLCTLRHIHHHLGQRQLMRTNQRLITTVLAEPHQFTLPPNLSVTARHHRARPPAEYPILDRKSISVSSLSYRLVVLFQSLQRATRVVLARDSVTLGCLHLLSLHELARLTVSLDQVELLLQWLSVLHCEVVLVL